MKKKRAARALLIAKESRIVTESYGKGDRGRRERGGHYDANIYNQTEIEE